MSESNDDTNQYGDLLGMLEHPTIGLSEVDQAVAFSLAISLKRIADALEPMSDPRYAKLMAEKLSHIESHLSVLKPINYEIALIKEAIMVLGFSKPL